MKVVDTQFRSEEPLTWSEIVDLITTGIYEEDFIVLLDKTKLCPNDRGRRRLRGRKQRI